MILFVYCQREYIGPVDSVWNPGGRCFVCVCVSVAAVVACMRECDLSKFIFLPAERIFVRCGCDNMDTDEDEALVMSSVYLK